MIPNNIYIGTNVTQSDVIIPPSAAHASQQRIIHLRSVQELRIVASAWDDLWQRSDVTFPTMRAELLAQWIEHFAAGAEFHAIAIEQNGRWVAALPMLRRKIGRLINAGVMPCNEWSSSGEFLLDLSADVDRVMQLFISALNECNWPLLWFDEAILDTARWRMFFRSVDNHHLKSLVWPRWQVGRVRIEGNWDAYKNRWSHKHRYHTSWSARQLARLGEVQLILHSNLTPDEAAVWMRRALEIENLGWKGRAGSSVLSTPAMSDFFIRQAQQLAAWGQLELVFLLCGGRPIAFCYGQSAKGVFHSAKIGYDPGFARYSPGQFLRYLLLKRFYAEPNRKALDFLGPITESHFHWRPETYTVARFAVALQPLGRLALWSYEKVKGLW